ncbi:MAG: hypothetical protein AB7E95_02485 [Kiritimatiellales bacterium]
MIDLHQSRRLADRRAWSGAVHRIFQTLEIDRRGSAEAVAESLAVFCQTRPYIPQHDLFLFMARSFCSAGDAEAAEQVLQNNGAFRHHTASWLNVLSRDYPFPELYPLFSARVLRPQELTSAGLLWILDFENIRLTDADRHELILYRTVRGLVEKVSNVWKNSDGQGTLGINGIHHPARLLQGPDAESLILDHIRAVVDRCARTHGWKHQPAILLVDL